jgi:hypothetical protein
MFGFIVSTRATTDKSLLVCVSWGIIQLYVQAGPAGVCDSGPPPWRRPSNHRYLRLPQSRSPHHFWLSGQLPAVQRGRGEQAGAVRAPRRPEALVGGSQRGSQFGRWGRWGTTSARKKSTFENRLILFLTEKKPYTDVNHKRALRHKKALKNISNGGWKFSL